MDGEHEELSLIEMQHPVSLKDSKGGRKRALYTGLGKGARLAKVQLPKRPSRAKARVKKSPPPPRTTKKEYHTHVGDPDLLWCLGLDPEVKTDNIDPPTDQKSATVEVPRWREKPFTSIDTYDGAENLDDKAFEKRHQKLEAEERRQLSDFKLPWVRTSRAQKRSKRSKTLH